MGTYPSCFASARYKSSHHEPYNIIYVETHARLVKCVDSQALIFFAFTRIYASPIAVVNRSDPSDYSFDVSTCSEKMYST